MHKILIFGGLCISVGLMAMEKEERLYVDQSTQTEEVSSNALLEQLVEQQRITNEHLKYILFLKVAATGDEQLRSMGLDPAKVDKRFEEFLRRFASGEMAPKSKASGMGSKKR